MRGGKPARRVRLALTPEKLAHAFLFLAKHNKSVATMVTMVHAIARQQFGGTPDVSDNAAPPPATAAMPTSLLSVPAST